MGKVYPFGLIVRLAAVLSAAVSPVSAQPDSFILTSRTTQPVLNSLRQTADGTLYYADAYGVYRLTGDRLETLLKNPVEGGYCVFDFFGMCLQYAPYVYHPKPIAADSAGTLYLADPELHLIQRYDPISGAFVTIASNAGGPTSLAADDDGGLYFNNPGACQVLRLVQGIITVVAGTGMCGYSNDGGLAKEADIASVRAIAVDRSGQLYIADDRGGVIRRVDTEGIVTTIAGTGTPGVGGEGTPALITPLDGPAGIAVDSSGNLYIAEANRNRIRMVGSDGRVRTIAGTGVAGHSGDYGPALAAQLTAPTCLSISRYDTLQICDSSLIRRLIPAAPGRWVLPVLGLVSSRISPGSWVMMLGDFNVPTMDWSGSIGPDGALPTSLGGVMVDINGIPCVISYVSPDRIDLRLPIELKFSGFDTIGLTIQGVRITFPLPFSPSGSEILSRMEDGKLYGAFADSELHWIGPELPAHPGDIVTFYATGLDIGCTPMPGVTLPFNAMQLVLNSRGYPLSPPRAFSPGVAELSIQIPSDLPEGDVRVNLFAGCTGDGINAPGYGFLSFTPMFLRVGR